MSAPAARGRGVAFFDVDETLIDCKSMASFLDYAATRLPGLRSWASFLADLDPDWDRSRGNAAYYRLWAGQSRRDALRLGQEWFDIERRDPAFFLPVALERLQQHRRAGHDIVLVTGSFDAPITPIAAHLHATTVLATGLAVDAGRYTGVLTRPMIGVDKAVAARDYLQRQHLPASDTWAYGDHSSDLPLLGVANHRYLIAPDPDLAAHAREDPHLAVVGRDARLEPLS